MTSGFVIVTVAALIGVGVLVEVWLRRGKVRPLARMAGPPQRGVPLGHEAVDRADLDAGLRAARQMPFALPQQGVNHTQAMSHGPQPMPDDENHAARWQRAFGKQD